MDRADNLGLVGQELLEQGADPHSQVEHRTSAAAVQAPAGLRARRLVALAEELEAADVPRALEVQFSSRVSRIHDGDEEHHQPHHLRPWSSSPWTRRPHATRPSPSDGPERPPRRARSWVARSGPQLQSVPAARALLRPDAKASSPTRRSSVLHEGLAAVHLHYKAESGTRVPAAEASMCTSGRTTTTRSSSRGSQAHRGPTTTTPRCDCKRHACGGGPR